MVSCSAVSPVPQLLALHRCLLYVWHVPVSPVVRGGSLCQLMAVFGPQLGGTHFNKAPAGSLWKQGLLSLPSLLELRCHKTCGMGDEVLLKFELIFLGRGLRAQGLRQG